MLSLGPALNMVFMGLVLYAPKHHTCRSQRQRDDNRKVRYVMQGVEDRGKNGELS